MRKVLSVILLIIFCAAGYSQKNAIGVYTSFFNSGSPFNLFAKGATGYTTDKTVRIGAEYKRMLGKWLSINGGIEYTHHDITYAFSSSSYYMTGMTMPNDKGYFQFITIPVYLRADLLKYVFFTFGTLLDIQAKSDRENRPMSLGITGGTGFKYDFKNKTTVFVHPFYQLHAINSHYATFGLRTGLSYRF